MKKKAHSESQMVSAVKELESGLSAESVARGHGISKATLYYNTPANSDHWVNLIK